MIDFSKRMTQMEVVKKINPVDIYDDLDRTSVTGPLRPLSQEEVLLDWHENYRNKKDLVVKLHTGAGKTLIGLLMLQSKINANEGPCLYICPNKYLMDQVYNESIKFGIKTCTIGSNNIIPSEYSNGKMILITYAQKLFNGKSIFGVGNNFIKAGCIVMDDAHACLDAIREAFIVSIKRSKNEDLYNDIFCLFEDDLKTQGEGTLLDIKENYDYESTMLIPYWAWIEKKTEVLRLLIPYADELFLTFTWQLIKNSLDKCQAFISGNEIEITPIAINMDLFGTFAFSNNRILMSATTQDDIFFIKTLNFDIDAVKNPLLQKKQTWAGEKMIVLPSLIDDSLDRDFIIEHLSKLNYKFGVVSLVPNWRKQKDYKDYGCTLADTENIFKNISSLKDGHFGKILVLANRYDGIDLPDNTCRLLIIDSLPFFTNMADKYEENCRVNCEFVQKKLAQKIEQGLGRSVRGEKDYSCIIIIGADLIKFIKSNATKNMFSAQTQKQIDLGMNMADWSKEDIKDDDKFAGFVALINQCLRRDDGWKTFYKREMNSVVENNRNDDAYKILLYEKKAEDLFLKDSYDDAIAVLQKLLDEFQMDKSDRGWYLQIISRFKYSVSKLEANKLQKTAFEMNAQLLKPKDGITYKKISNINVSRMKKLVNNIMEFDSYDELMLDINSILADLSFGVESEKFERGFERLGIILGFESHRPDKMIRKGPDDLWCINNNSYIIIECKSEVKEDRKEIYKSEAGQMNNHCAWFDSEYENAKVLRILAIPTNILAYDADFSHEVKIMRKNRINMLKKNVLGFYKELKEYDIKNLTEDFVDKCVHMHELDEKSILSKYVEDWKRK